MALSYVGSKTSSGTASTYNLSLTSLSGGSGGDPLEGDIVIVAVTVTGTTNVDLSVSGYTELADLYGDDTRDTNLFVGWKKMGSTPDTSATVPGSGSAANGGSAIAYVIRGAHQTTPFNVTTTTATGINAALANAPAITPTTSGSWVIAVGGATGDTGPTAMTGPSGMTSFRTQNGTGSTMSAITGVAYFAWTSGAYDPAAWTAGESTTSDSWAAASLVIQPGPTPALTQAAYRYYEDGTESGSTAIAAQDTNITRDVTSDSSLALRARLQDTAGAGVLYSSTDDYQLQYELNDSGNFYSIGFAPGVDGYDFINYDASLAMASDLATKVSQSFTGNGATLQTANLYCAKAGSPTGNAVAEIYAHSGTFGTSSLPTGSALATSDTFDVSTLGTSLAWTQFVFSGANQITLTNATNYVLVMSYSGGSGVTRVNVGVDTTSGTHAGNRASFTASWTAAATQDLPFSINQPALPVIGFNSGSLTDGGATTNRLGAGTGSFLAGEIAEDGVVDDLQMTASNYTELLYSLTLASSGLANNDTLDFRVLRNTLTTGMTYTVTPRITASKSVVSNTTNFFQMF